MPHSDIFKVTNTHGILLHGIKIRNFDKYDIELILENSLSSYHNHYEDQCLQICNVSEKNLVPALEKLFIDFKKVRKCPQCFEINENPSDQSRICVNCCIKSALGFEEIKCAICLENTCNYVTLPCTHKFHAIGFSKISGEYRRYERSHECCRKCPLCRVNIIIHKDGCNVSFVKFKEEE